MLLSVRKLLLQLLRMHKTMSTVEESVVATPVQTAVRKRPRPGERRVQILQALAAMLQQPGGERITTAALAARLEVSEAAFYRHFASKAQMFEALIDFIEQSIFGLINQIAEREAEPHLRAPRILGLLLQFAEKNPGMARVMVGDALVLEHERLQQRINLMLDKIESSLRKHLRQDAESGASATPSVDAQVRSSLMLAFAVGRMQRYVRTEFRRPPTEHLDACLRQLLM